MLLCVWKEEKQEYLWPAWLVSTERGAINSTSDSTGPDFTRPCHSVVLVCTHTNSSSFLLPHVCPAMPTTLHTHWLISCSLRHPSGNFLFPLNAPFSIWDALPQKPKASTNHLCVCFTARWGSTGLLFLGMSEKLWLLEALFAQPRLHSSPGRW